ncbi:hypothetical protein [Nocardia sp. NPDC058480]|uniref:hypothetical protein n=1 Tax=Nocardia sp. NPDC058480 TaxID=3346522 RepID=UPI003647CA96
MPDNLPADRISSNSISWGRGLSGDGIESHILEQCVFDIGIQAILGYTCGDRDEREYNPEPAAFGGLILFG